MFTYCTLFESRILTSLFKIGNLISRHTYIIINKMELKMCSISFTYLHFCLLFQMSCKTQNEEKKTEFVNMYLHICLYSKVYSTTATYISEWLFFISKTLMVCFSVTIHLDFLFFISQTSKCICI